MFARAVHKNCYSLLVLDRTAKPEILNLSVTQHSIEG